jgi:hypothetical protein
MIKEAQYAGVVFKVRANIKRATLVLSMSNERMQEHTMKEMQIYIFVNQTTSLLYE